MFTELPWCVIVNLQTCKTNEWRKWQSLLEKNQIHHIHFQTHTLDQLSGLIASLLSQGHRYFLFAGGDGTLHQGGNILIQHGKEILNEVVIGVLRCGTGNDWDRSFGITNRSLIASLKQRKKVPLNLLCLEWPGGRKRFAFNMTGAALDAAVVDSLNQSSFPFPGAIKYPIALLKTLTKPHEWQGTIIVDGRQLDGKWLTIQAGFGQYCGGGMYVLPHAEENKAALLLMKPKTLGKLITSLPKLYNGKIAQQKEAIAMHFSTLEIKHSDNPIPIEADGEFLGYSPVIITSIFDVLHRLGHSE
jgi:diacylglycerol kinase family enzyme